MKQGQVRFSIKTRMILLVGLVIALIVVTTSIFSYYNAQDMMGSAIAREAQTIVRRTPRLSRSGFKQLRMKWNFSL